MKLLNLFGMLAALATVLAYIAQQLLALDTPAINAVLDVAPIIAFVALGYGALINWIRKQRGDK